MMNFLDLQYIHLSQTVDLLYATVLFVFSDCPTSVKTTPSGGQLSVGTVLKCEADAVPSPIYRWTVDSIAVNNATDSEFTLNKAGNYTVECIATNYLTGTGNECSSRAAAIVQVEKGNYYIDIINYHLTLNKCTAFRANTISGQCANLSVVHFAVCRPHGDI